MYISNDNGVTNSYTIANEAVRVHFYRNVTIPVVAANIKLNFDIKVQGESTYDYVRVYFMPSNISPTVATTSISIGGTDPNAQYIVGNYYSRGTLGTANTWQNVNVDIPATWSGQTGRLVFTWNNDGSAGYQPPAAIDNISITCQPAITVPAPATFATPYNAGNLISVDTELRWIPDAFATPATEFTLYFGETAEALAPVYTGELTSYTPATPLDYATTYYWKVVPANAFGIAVVCPVWSFTTTSENVTIISNGTVASSFAPMSAYNFTVSQMIYTQEELAAVGIESGLITHISFQAAANTINFTSENINNWLIYMGTTEQEIYTNTEVESWVPLAEMTEVKRGVISETNLTAYQWVTIELDTPFEYTGNGNLVVFVNEYGLSSYGSPQWSGNNATAYRTIYRYAQGTEPFEPEGEVAWNAGAGGGRSATRPNLALTLATYSVSGTLQLSPEATSGSVAGLTVMLSNNDGIGIAPAPVTSNENGAFTFPSVRLGTYNLSVSRANVAPYTHGEVIEVIDEDITDLLIVLPLSLADGDIAVSPMVTTLRTNYPNPFNPSTTIAFDVARTGHVSIDIYNIKGQRVRSLVSGDFKIGSHKVVWNGDDTAGRSVGSGVYFYRMTTDGYTNTRKMLLIK